MVVHRFLAYIDNFVLLRIYRTGDIGVKMKEFYDGDFSNETSESPLVEMGGLQNQGAPPQTEQNQPFYVNAKQYHRILKRRIARAKLEEKLKVERIKKPYLHESRHKHAMRRPRGQGGRFLTAAEIAEQKKQEELQQQQKNQNQDSANPHEASSKDMQQGDSMKSQEDHNILSLDN